jgi:type III secretory pathway component EscS
LAEIFKNSFIGYLFDLVEQTRDMEDETFNYSVIKLIVSSQVLVLSFLLKGMPGVLERTVYGSTAFCKYAKQGQARNGRKNGTRKSRRLSINAPPGIQQDLRRKLDFHAQPGW